MVSLAMVHLVITFSKLRVHIVCDNRIDTILPLHIRDLGMGVKRAVYLGIVLIFAAVSWVWHSTASLRRACVAHAIKLRLVKSAKQSRSLCSGPLSVYQELSKSHDWPLEKANVELPIRMKGNSQLTSDNSFIRWAPRTSISALLRRRY